MTDKPEREDTAAGIPQWHTEQRDSGGTVIKDAPGRVVAVCPKGTVAKYIVLLHNSGGDRDQALDAVMGSVDGKLIAGSRPRPKSVTDDPDNCERWAKWNPEGFHDRFMR